MTITTRNLVDTDIGPLRRFTGILDSLPTKIENYGEGDSARSATRVSINFRDIDVKEAVEPYHFPIYTLQANLSNRKRSRWGVLSTSFNTIADLSLTPDQLDPSKAEFVKVIDRTELQDVIGKRLGMVLTDGEDGRPDPHSLYDGRTQAEKPTSCWVVYSIEGIVSGQEGSQAEEVAMKLLDGKTISEFNTTALANDTIRKDTKLIQAITRPLSAPDSFVAAMVAAGKFTVDSQGVYHKVA